MENAVALGAPFEAHVRGQVRIRRSHRPPLLRDIRAAEEERSIGPGGQVPVPGHDDPTLFAGLTNDLVVGKPPGVRRVASHHPQIAR